MTTSSETKKCRTCSQEKSLTEFYKDAGKSQGVSGQCKECCKKDRRDKYTEDPQTILNRNLQWRAENPDWAGDYYACLKREVFGHYGGHCVCCGESEMVFLCLDHIHDDGAEHRKTVSGAWNMLLWIRKQGYPEDVVQILCMNCNWAKYMGGCPHQLEVP